MSKVTLPLSTRKLREKDRAALKEDLDALKAELSHLRVKKASDGGASGGKYTRLTRLRKAIAQIHTIYTKSIRAEARKNFKKKHLPYDLRPRTTRAIRNRISPAQAAALTLAQKKKIRHNPKRHYLLKA